MRKILFVFLLLLVGCGEKTQDTEPKTAVHTEETTASIIETTAVGIENDSEPRTNLNGAFAVGNTGQYIKNRDNYKSTIEDKKGIILYSVKGSIYALDKDKGIYAVFDENERYLMNKDLYKFGDDSDIRPDYYCIKFDDLHIIAKSDQKKNLLKDPANTELTEYYDTDGKPIDDVYKYIKDHGKQPENGVYITLHTGFERKFVRRYIQKGVYDNGIFDTRVYPRVPVGKKGHYLVGDDAENGRGFLIEDEEGNDLYGYLDSWGYISIELSDPENEIYSVKRDPDPNHDYDDEFFKLDSDFREFDMKRYW